VKAPGTTVSASHGKLKQEFKAKPLNLSDVQAVRESGHSAISLFVHGYDEGEFVLAEQK
jgi:hypothetical protein